MGLSLLTTSSFYATVKSVLSWMRVSEHHWLLAAPCQPASKTGKEEGLLSFFSDNLCGDSDLAEFISFEYLALELKVEFHAYLYIDLTTKTFGSVHARALRANLICYNPD